MCGKDDIYGSSKTCSEYRQQIYKCTNTEMHKYRNAQIQEIPEGGFSKGDNPLPIFLQQGLPMNQCFVRIVNCKNSKH